MKRCFRSIALAHHANGNSPDYSDNSVERCFVQLWCFGAFSPLNLEKSITHSTHTGCPFTVKSPDAALCGASDRGAAARPMERREAALESSRRLSDESRTSGFIPDKKSMSEMEKGGEDAPAMSVGQEEENSEIVRIRVCFFFFNPDGRAFYRGRFPLEFLSKHQRVCSRFVGSITPVLLHSQCSR